MLSSRSCAGRTGRCGWSANPKKSRGLLREGEQLKFALIDAEKANVPVATACKALGVSRAGFYAWRGRPESKRSSDDRRLAVKVRESFERSRTFYGSPRVLKDLRAADEHVSRKRVIRLMKVQGLVARVRRHYRCTTVSDHDQPVAANLLARRFEAECPTSGG